MSGEESSATRDLSETTGSNGEEPNVVPDLGGEPAETGSWSDEHVPRTTEVRGELDDSVREEMREIIARYPQSRSALLPMLHLVQSYEGCVTSAGIEMCADELGITAAEVSAVATFYTMYKRRPVGDYHVGVCTNTLCAIMGGDAIWASLSDKLGIGQDETTEDGRVSLERVECNAACDFAPVVMVNWEFMDNQTSDKAGELVDKLRDGESVKSTRGPSIGTFKEASRVLAGFPDGRAGEGEQAGAATLAGLVLAHEHGWAAPEGGRPELENTAAPASGSPGASSTTAGDNGGAQDQSKEGS